MMGMQRVLVTLILAGLVASASYAVDASTLVESASTAPAGGAPGEIPAHYFVFEYQAGGTITPLSYQPARITRNTPRTAPIPARTAAVTWKCWRIHCKG